MKLHRIAIFGAALAVFATEPNDATRRWWGHILALANDGMEGRDTGSQGYRNAERYVVSEFEKAGLKPAGEKGYTQSVALHEVRFQAAESSVELVRPDGVTKLQWLRQITVPARLGLPETLAADMVFLGDGPAAGAAALDPRGKIVVQLPAIPRATTRPTTGAAAPAGRGAGRGNAGGRAGTIAIDTTGGPEPPRWPVAYSVVPLQSGFCRRAFPGLRPHFRRAAKAGGRWQTSAAIHPAGEAARHHEIHFRRPDQRQYRGRTARVRPRTGRPIRGGFRAPGWLRHRRTLERRQDLQRGV